MLSPTPIDRPSLHPGAGYLIAPRVPHGLAAVVEGLTREVLRHRPEDIYVFAAHHFEKLLKLREQYQAEEYSDREFNYEFSRDFNIWPIKGTRDIQKFSNDGWSLEKEIEILEERRKRSTDAEESLDDVSTDRENRKASKQTCSRGPSTTKKSSKRSKDETTSDARATRIISQMSALHGPGKSIQTKDIKQELRKNKLSGEKSKTSDGTEKGIRGERRSKTKVPKTDKGLEKEAERATRTTARRPLKKVRRIETESETETEREAAKNGAENGHERSSVKSDRTSRETTTRADSRERRLEARLSEHSSERKVSSRAFSMDRIRAYVLRKFASTASLEVLRSPTYVEQVQEVIDRAAPIIKERLEEIRRPRGKRSRSVDLAWNEESLRQHIRDGKKRGDRVETEEDRRENNGNGLERKAASITSKEDTENSLGRDETILTMEREEKKQRRRSVGSGKKSRRRENGGHGDFGIVDQVDNNSKRNDKLELESSATRDTLEARLTATQSILEGISKSTSELNGARRAEPAGSEPSESEASDHVNIVSLPIVRPPSSRNSRSATKNGSDSLTLPPISPEVPKSMKKKDELSLPVLSAATNGNHSARKPQEQEVSKDADEASTMRDITSDIEDIAVLPEDGHEDVIIDTKQNPSNDTDLISDIRFIDEEKHGKDVDKVFGESISGKFEKRGSLEEFEELERRRMEEVYKDSLNVTPEVADVPSRPDSLESDQDEIKLHEDNVDPARDNTFDGLKDKLIEIEMAERNIEKALASQQVTTYDGSEMSQAEKSMTDGKINEARKSVNEMEETVSKVKKLMDAEKISMNKNDDGKREDDEKEESISTNEIEKVKGIIKISSETESSSTEEKSTNKVEKLENKIEKSINEIENSTNETETANKVEKLTNESEVERLQNEIEILKDEVEKAVDQAEISTKIADEAIKIAEDEKSIDKTESSINEKVPNGVEELAVKVHVEKLQSINPQGKDNQIVEVIACETDDDNTTTSKEKAENTNEFSKTTASENVTTKSEISITNIPNENNKTKRRKKRESDKLPITSLPLEVPFSYVLSEGSPCEIPDSVTTVIIPDRPCPSPVTLEDEDQFGLIDQKEDSLIFSDIVEDEIHEKNRHGCGMEVFGEYIQPEAAVLPVDIDFVRGMKGTKPSQDIAIAHQDLDKIKEEGEEEEEKEDAEEKEIESYQEKENDEQAVVQDQETMKHVGTLEDIVEHEENEEIDVRTISESKNVEEISSPVVPEHESLLNTELMADAALTDEGRTGVTNESRGTIENSLEESGSTQDTHTTTSSDVKESTASNRSIESPSLSRPVVPELNLDSLQDNTVSSFKMTANETTKEDNGSPRESDATTSLIEPLTSDERLMNRLTLAEEEAVVEKFMGSDLQSEVPEADRLYQAEHAEYEWLEKDPLSSETNLEDETKSQDSLGLQALPEDVVLAGPLLREKEEGEELSSEEEIARELIGSLDDIRAKESDLKEESKDNRKPEKGNLDVDDKSNQSPSELMPSMSIDEQEKREHEVSLEGIDEEIAKIETISELSSQTTDINQDDKSRDNAITETEETKSEVTEKEVQVAPLAQFEQDDLLEQNGQSKMADEKIIVESKPDVNFTDVNSDNQEKSEDKQTSIENVMENQNVESMSKIEDSNEIQKENEQEKLQGQEENEPEKLQGHEENEQEKLQGHEECQEKLNNQEECQEKLNNQEECQEKLNDQEECEQEKSKAYEECKPEESEVQEKHDQENLKIQEKDDQGNLEQQEEIVDVKVLSDVTESKKDSTNESMRSDDEHEETIRDESVSDDQTEKDVKNKKEEKIRDLSAEIENVHGPIINAVSQQSREDHPHRGFWTMETKSSTVETVIEASSPNTSTDEKTEERAVNDTPEIESKSLIQKKDDFYSAVIKIQACVRGFLGRRRMRLNSKPVSNNIPSMKKTAMGNHLMLPSNLRETRSGRQRLRREEALRNTTLSLENAFATSRLQHTGEFHDSVPLPLFDLTSSKTSSNSSNESLNKEVEDDIKQVNEPDIAKSSANESDSGHDNKHETSFQKSKAFVDPTFPIVMHLLADASRNCHFTVNQNSHSGFNVSAGGAKAMEPTMDILMLGYPRDDENRYLNFITSVEDLGTNMDSLPLDGIMKSSESTVDAHPSVTSGEGSLREPLALPGTPQGIIIEEVTSLDEAVHVPSESTKSSTAPKTSLDTNNSMPSEISHLEDEKNDLETSPKTTDAMEDRKHIEDQEAEEQKSNCNLESVEESDSRSENANKNSNGISRDNHERLEEKNEKS